MQKNTAALLIGCILLITAGTIVVPPYFSSDEVPLMQWDAADEVEVAVETGDLASAEAFVENGERSAVEIDAGALANDEARVALILRGRIVDKFLAPVAGATVWLGYSRSRGGRGGFAFGATQRRIPDPVLTDSEGRFAFQGETFRNLRVSLQVTHKTHAAGTFDRDLGEVGPEVDLGDLTLKNGGAIMGRVTDLEGNGVAAARIELGPQGNNTWRFLRNRDKTLPAFETDNSGYYNMQHAPEGEWVITATAQHHTEGRSSTFAVEEDQQTQVDDIRLGPGFEVTGYVRTVQGQPIAKAQVTMRGSDRGQQPDDGQSGPGPGRGGRGGRGNFGGGRTHATQTDAEGRFFLEHLPGVAMNLTVRAEGFLQHDEQEVDPRVGQPLHISMQEGLRIAGTVLDGIDSQPVTMFSVRANRVRGLPIPGLENVDIGELMQRMRDGNLDDASRQQIRSQMEALRSQMGDGGGPGRGPDRGGNRRGGRDGGNGGGRDETRPEKHPEGTFVVTGLQEGIYEVAVQSPDHAFYRSAEVEVRSGAGAPSLMVRLDRGLFFAGLVLDDRDLPIRNAAVTLVAADPVDGGGGGRGRNGGGNGGRPDFAGMARQWQRMAAGTSVRLEAKTDKSGEFVFTHVPKGNYELRAEADGFAASDDVAIELLTDRSDGEVRLAGLGSIAGAVRGLQAADAGQSGVAAVRMDGNQGGGFGGFGRGRGGFQRADIAADGAYKIDGLAPGNYLVRAWAGEQQDIMRQMMPLIMSGELQPDVTVKAGEVAHLDLIVTRAMVGNVAGSIMHNGDPAKGFRVELAAVESGGQTNGAGQGGGGPGGGRGNRGGRGGFWGGRQEATVTGSGTFKIDRVTAGEYTLRVRTEDRTMVHEEPIFVAADATTERHISVLTSSLRGAVTAPDAANENLNGSITLHAGLATMPDDYREWRRTNGDTAINGRVRDGKFEFGALPPGNYLMVLSIRGREQSSATIVVTGGSNETSLVAGSLAPESATPGAGAVPPSGGARPAGGNGGRRQGGGRNGGARQGGGRQGTNGGRGGR
ncbi:MAG: carboxypeptidase regulatory-like domain-containing protein [Planctomycetes bacterium]|nr:carboxypeptidase regulatory-like domain-containing protein [Planctomycetota bacterium]